MTHEFFDVMRRVLQASCFQLLAEQPAELKAAIGIGIVDGEEDRVAFEPVAEVTLLAFVLPCLQKRVRHRVVMNGEEEIGRGGIRTRHTIVEALLGRPVGHEQKGLGKAGSEQFLLDQCREAKVKVIFVEAARADSAGNLGRMPDVDDDPKRRPITGRFGRFLAGTAGGAGPAGMPCARPRRERSNHDADRSDPPEEVHQT